MMILFLLVLGQSCSTHINNRRPSNVINCSEAIELILEKKLSSTQKARAINDLEGSVKGSFSEIGAGQSISAKFFEAQRASETIVKSISAYGKEQSDRLYGSGVRYVSEQRLDQMLEVEFSSLKSLKDKFKRDVKLFSLANSVTTNSDGGGHGWLGIRFANMRTPRRHFQEIKIHFNFGKASLEDQHEELGKLGVNLVHYLFGKSEIPKGENLIGSLVDGVQKNVINLDAAQWTWGAKKVGTPSIDLIDSEAAVFVILNDLGKSITSKDLFYKKNVLVLKDGQEFETSSEYLKLRLIDWDKTLQSVGHDKKKAIALVKKRMGKGEHIVLLGKDGEKQIYDELSRSMNSSNNILLEIDSVLNLSTSALRHQLEKMKERNLTPIMRGQELDALPRNLRRILLGFI